jgi:hypothetical protein
MPSYYFGYGYSFGSGAGSTNCYMSLTNYTGTTWGHLDTTNEDLVPDVTADGTYIYEASFDTSDGSFIMSFGVAGNEQLDNCLLIIKEFDTDHVELHWNATTTQYEGTNQALATELALSVGQQVCFRDVAIPDLLIDIDFSTLEVV